MMFSLRSHVNHHRGVERSGAVRGVSPRCALFSARDVWCNGGCHAGSALGFLEDAVEAGFRDNRWPMIDPVMDTVRDEPRFEALLDVMRQDVAEQRQRVERVERAAGLR